MCKHLEKVLSSVYSKNSVKSIPQSWVGASKRKPTKSAQDIELAFRRKLTHYALPPIYIDVLTLRFVYEMVLQDIAEELSMPNRQAVFTVIVKAQAILRERNFK